MSEPDIVIRSYRLVFQLERRLHKFDHWRIPLPYGLPLRGILYAAGLLLTVLVLQQLPLVSQVVSVLHPSLRYVAIPVGGAYALMQLAIDGRDAIATGLSWARYRTQPRHLVGLRGATPSGRAFVGAVTVSPDERGGRHRKAIVEGSGEVCVRHASRLAQRGRTLRVFRGEPDAPPSGKRIRIRPGQRVVVEP